MDLAQAADKVGREFLASIYRNVREDDATYARNAILDCWCSATEDDFIRRACEHSAYQRTARRVIRRMAPHLVELAGRAYAEAQHGTPA